MGVPPYKLFSFVIKFTSEIRGNMSGNLIHRTIFRIFGPVHETSCCTEFYASITYQSQSLINYFRNVKITLQAIVTGWRLSAPADCEQKSAKRGPNFFSLAPYSLLPFCCIVSFHVVLNLFRHRLVLLVSMKRL